MGSFPDKIPDGFPRQGLPSKTSILLAPAPVLLELLERGEEEEEEERGRPWLCINIFVYVRG